MYKISTEKGENKMAKFVPLTFLKDTASIVEFCQECGEPVFVTRNGTPELVIMDSEFFDEYLRYRKEDGRLDIRREFASVPKTITITASARQSISRQKYLLAQSWIFLLSRIRTSRQSVR